MIYLARRICFDAVFIRFFVLSYSLIDQTQPDFFTVVRVKFSSSAFRITCVCVCLVVGGRLANVAVAALLLISLNV